MQFKDKMKFRWNVSRPNNLTVMALVIFCCMKVMNLQTNCSEGVSQFMRVLCMEDLNVKQMDLYRVGKMSFQDCMNNCAKDAVCRSFLFDSRHDTCALNRLKDSNTTSIPGGKLFLKYGIEDDCDTVPEAECYLSVNNIAVYAGRLVTGTSGITCQRWVDQFPHKHDYTNPNEYPDGSLAAAENFCRGLGYHVPWCYTLDPAVRWKACAVPSC